MKSFIISSDETWREWRAAWQKLTHANPMQSWEWLHAWWKTFGVGHQLNILAITSNGELVGVVPCYLHQTAVGRQLRFLGSGSISSDYLSAVVVPACSEDAYRKIRDHLKEFANKPELRDLDSLYLEGLADSDPWLQQLEEFSQESGYSYRLKSMVNSWRLTLPSTWEQFIASKRGKSVFRKAKKCVSRLKAGDVAVRFLTDPTQLDEGLEQLIRLHQARRSSLGEGGCFEDPRFEPFLREAVGAMLARGTAQFAMCSVAGNVIGIQLQLLSENCTYMYQSGFDPDAMALEPGHLLITASLIKAMDDGRLEYDFLRGDEPYKDYWGATPIMLKCAVLAPPTLKSQALERVSRNLSWLRTWSNESISPLFGKSN